MEFSLATRIVGSERVWQVWDMSIADVIKTPDVYDSECATARDVRWMRLVAQGDVEAFECLVNEHKGRVVGTVAKMLGDSTEAEDIAQEVFVRVWKSARHYKPSAKFTTWLMTIVRNLVFNETRRRKRKPTEALNGVREPSRERQFEDMSAQSPADEVLLAELEVEVQSAIEALPEAQRMALVLRRYEEMTYEEIAEVLKTSVPAVKSLLFRARNDLRARLERHLGG